MKISKKVLKRILCSSLSVVLTAAMILSFPFKASAENTYPGSGDLKIDYHTKAEIAHFIKDHPTANAYLNNFAVAPSTSAPYSLGAVADSTLNDSLNLLNIYRYIAGVPANVTLNSEYNELAQAAAVTNAANGVLTHFPNQPAGMSDEMYKKGSEGASSSNIAYGWASWTTSHYNIGKFMDSGWMSDGDSSNIDRVGHRRWVINPTMAQTGFGLAINSSNQVYSAMYSFDTNNTGGANYSAVAWPAQNTPVGYFNASDPWSLSMGEEVNSAEVTVTCVNTNQTWRFSGTPDCSKTTDSGFFNINNDGYGQSGCIIFAPKGGVNVEKGYSYKVNVSGSISKSGWIEEKTGPYSWRYYWGVISTDPFAVSYTVDFFDINDYMDQPVNQPLTDEQKEQVRAFVERFYKVILDRSDESIKKDPGVDGWVNSLISGEKSGADIARGFAMSNEFTGKGLNDDEFLKKMYLGFFDREPDSGGYNNWKNKIAEGYTREYVIGGFVNSGEFKALCDRYGINPGTFTVNQEKNPGQPQQPQPAQPSGLKPLEVDTSNVDDEQLTAFVQRLYDKALAREGEADGVDYWKGCILNGKDSNNNIYDIRTVISKGFLNSREYQNRGRSEAEFVLDCYQAFFNRSPIGAEDEPNYWDWVHKLESGEYTRQQMIEHGFGDSKEFRNLITSYGFVILN